MKIYEIFDYENELEGYLKDILLILKEKNRNGIPLEEIIDILKKEYPKVVDDSDIEKIREIIGKQDKIVKGIFGNKVYFIEDFPENKDILNVSGKGNDEEFDKLVKSKLKKDLGI